MDAGRLLTDEQLLADLALATNASFAKTYVRDQLSQQRITFARAEALTPEERRSACLLRYAGAKAGQAATAAFGAALLLVLLAAGSLVRGIRAKARAGAGQL